MIRSGKYYQHPPQVWDFDKCRKLSRRVTKDGLGTKYPFPGYIGSSQGPGGYGRQRYNGGCVRNGNWYEGEEFPLPKIDCRFVIIAVPTWGYRIEMANWLNKINLTSIIQAEVEPTPKEAAAETVKRLRELLPKLDFGMAHEYRKQALLEKFVVIIEDLEDVEDIDDYNVALDHLYDLGDSAPSSLQLRDKLLWVETNCMPEGEKSNENTSPVEAAGGETAEVAVG